MGKGGLVKRTVARDHASGMLIVSCSQLLVNQLRSCGLVAAPKSELGYRNAAAYQYTETERPFLQN